MSLFNRAIGFVDALGTQARTYKMGRMAQAGKRIASDIATRSGGLTSIKRYAAFGAGLGGVAGGAYDYYNGGDARSIAGGALRGAAMGAAIGGGYRAGTGIRSSLRGGVLGGYASSARAAVGSRVRMARYSNNVNKAYTSSFSFV